MASGPKWSRAALDVVNNTYVVRNGLLYEYYPISVNKSTLDKKFIKLEISPPVMMPGVAIVDKQLYDVTLEDLLRRRINVAKRHVPERNRPGNSPTKKTKSTEKSAQYSDSQRSSKTFGVEVSQVADMAWQNQVDTLLEALHSEEGEEFEITSSPQSGPVDESRSVSDMFEDT